MSQKKKIVIASHRRGHLFGSFLAFAPFMFDFPDHRLACFGIGRRFVQFASVPVYFFFSIRNNSLDALFHHFAWCFCFFGYFAVITDPYCPWIHSANLPERSVYTGQFRASYITAIGHPLMGFGIAALLWHRKNSPQPADHRLFTGKETSGIFGADIVIDFGAPYPAFSFVLRIKFSKSFR